MTGASDPCGNDARALVITVMVAGLPIAAEIPAESLEVLRQAITPPIAPVHVSPYLSADEAAEILRCRKRRVYELVGDGRLTRAGDGRRLLVLRDEVERLASGELTCR